MSAVAGVATGAVVCLVEHETSGPAGLSLQALTLARGYAEAGGCALEALVIGTPSEPTVAALAGYGVTAVHVADGAELTGAYCGRAWGRALETLLAPGGGAGSGGGGGGVRAVVAAGSDRGSEAMAHLAAMTSLPLAAGCVSAVPEPGSEGASAVAVTRVRWGGSLLEDAVLAGSPALLTVAPQTVAAVPAATGGAARLVPLEVMLGEQDLVEAVAAVVPRAAGAVTLAEARVVVGGGRGVGSPEGFAVLEELAALLGGTVGGSRVATSLGWRPHRDQVGQTGTRIAPELYIACGISGAIQHMAGCKSAKHLLAINTDAEAPIMRAADYAVVGDLHAVLGEVIRRLRAVG